MSVSLITLRSNRNFLDYYHDYIKREWRRHYFSYDVLKEEYKALKWKDKPKLHRFEKDFLEEIKRVDWFIKATLFEIQQDLRKISETKALFLDEMQMAKRKAQDEKTVEITLRAIYEKCNDIEQFYSLNRFAICKIAKKFEKLIDQSLLDDSHKDEADGFIDFDPWRDHKSNEYFTQKFVPREKIIQALSNKCKAMYKLFFRRRYPTLAEGELDFVKNKARIHKSTQVLFGMKVGAIILLIIWLVVDSNTQSNDFDFWEQPGLFVYTTVGNLLFFRFLWSANVYLWSRFDINYIPLLSLSNNRPNTLMIVNTTSTWMLLYCVNLLVFYFDNESVSDTAVTKRSYICPMLLVAWTLGAEAFDYFYRFGPNSRFSRGLFSRRVIYRCVTAPLSALQFRDIYAADVMTSFTKVISDTLYATCWFLSGAFRTPHDNELDQTISSSTDFGSSYMQCTSQQMVYCVVLFECIPLWIRFLQCCRQSYDGQGQVWPFGFNALKYLLSMLVVLMGVRRTVSSDDIPYVTLIVITALYKWWWDVVMDWGLFDVLPAWCAPFCPMATSSIEAARSKPLTGGATGETTSNSNKSDSSSSGKQPSALLEDDRPHLFLRKQLMYPYVGVYYVCIFLDLILRFLWVVSLVPESIFGSFVGPQLSLFLGSMEIFRRAMWGCFRLEYEHLKHVTKGSPGFLKFRRVEYLLPGSKVSQRYDFGGTDRPETSGDGGDHRSSFRLSVELADDSVQDLERILEASTNERKSKVLATGAADPVVVKMLGEIDGDVEVDDGDDDDNDADDHRGDTNDPGSFSSVYSMQTLPSAAVVSNPLNAQQSRSPIHAPPYSSRGESVDITIASRMVSIDHGADV